MTLTRISCFFFVLLYLSPAFSQPLLYSTANAHSHNDYEQRIPFFEAYHQEFGSIEADIHLAGKLLLVSHDSANMVRRNTLKNMYLDPLAKLIKQNGGYAYKDSSRKLQLLIDVKTSPAATLNALIHLLDKFPSIIHNPSVLVVITGNRPDESLYTSYPAYIHFDGVLEQNYTVAALSRIVMMSDDFRKYSSWTGNDSLPDFDRDILTALVNKAHRLQKPIRFWACPDSSMAWKEMMSLQVDFLNTDHIEALAEFLGSTNGSATVAPYNQIIDSTGIDGAVSAEAIRVYPPKVPTDHRAFNP